MASMTRRPLAFTALVLLGLASCARSDDTAPPASPTPTRSAAVATPGAPRPPPEWVVRSNDYARPFLELMTRYNPESAAQLGVEGFDDRILDYTPGHRARSRADVARIRDDYRARAASETDPRVKQDLAILEHAADLALRDSEITERKEVPYLGVSNLVFGSIRSLLDERVAPARRPAAVARLRKYTGLEPGTKPLTELARTETLEKLGQPGLMAPSKMEIEKALQTSDVMIDGVAKLFEQYKLAGYEEPLRAYKAQIAAYHDWLKTDVLPKARTDFRLDPEVYAIQLENYGVDAKPEDIAALGHKGFDETQAEMQKVAAVIARDRHLPSADYRDVLRELKKEQVVGDAILPLYRQRLADIEAIIRREHLVTLPERPAKIRLASEAESAQIPAPFMSPPRLLGNTGEQGEFVLPLRVPPQAGSKEKDVRLDDFTYAAASWTLTAHEARPGHELQFASIVEQGVSTARAVFAFNSANVEGWGLYAEAITYPYMPPEGQLVSLQLRLGRAAREFLDPELQMGKMTPDGARALLQKDVGYSEVFANSEVERYTFRAPGQATSYFYGYTRLMDLRRDLEAKLGSKFDLGRFDDWVIAQGMLPPRLLREAAMRDPALQGG
jgi:hypothetical protein